MQYGRMPDGINHTVIHHIHVLKYTGQPHAQSVSGEYKQSLIIATLSLVRYRTEQFE